MNSLVSQILKNFELSISFLEKVLYDTFKTEGSLMSQEGREILNNSEDRKKIESAVEELKKTKKDSKEIELSNNRKIKVSIN